MDVLPEVSPGKGTLFFKKKVALCQKILYISALAEIACRVANLSHCPPTPEQTGFQT